MNIIDKILVLLCVVSFCMLIGSLFYRFILAFLNKLYSEVGLMVAFSAFRLLISSQLLK